MMLSLILGLIQTAVDPFPVPVSLPRQRAESALRRAEDGQALAQRYLCEDPGRVRDLQELNERFAKVRTLFAARFGASWRGETQDAVNGAAQQAIDDLGRRDDCRLRDSFFAGISEFENALRTARSEIEARPDR